MVYFLEALEFGAVMFMICSHYRFMIGTENVAMTQKYHLMSWLSTFVSQIYEITISEKDFRMENILNIPYMSPDQLVKSAFGKFAMSWWRIDVKANNDISCTALSHPKFIRQGLNRVWSGG